MHNPISAMSFALNMIKKLFIVVILIETLHNKVQNGTLVVRKIDKNVYKRFNRKAIEENKTMGETLNQAMDYWI